MAHVPVSVIVVAYNIPREINRTLHSLSPAYQRDIAAEDYEVLVVDNGSVPPLDREFVASFGANFRLIRIDDAAAFSGHDPKMPKAGAISAHERKKPEGRTKKCPKCHGTWEQFNEAVGRVVPDPFVSRYFIFDDHSTDTKAHKP